MSVRWSVTITSAGTAYRFACGTEETRDRVLEWLDKQAKELDMERPIYAGPLGWSQRE